MLTLLTGFLAGLIGKLPLIKVPVISINSVVMDIINAVWYFLPMETVFNIFAFGIAVTLFRLALAIIIRLKSFIPFSGGA